MKRRSMLTLLSAVLFIFLPFSIYGLTGFGDSAENETLDETLPVQLSSFTALHTNAGFVQLQWTAETETNMLGYYVYRAPESRLADAFVINSEVIPANNKSTTTDYSFLDEEVTPGNTYYYWLQNMNLDLTNEFHGPISITLEEQGEGSGELPAEFVTKLIGTYPNPFNPGTFIQFSLEEATSVTITIYNTRGQLVRTLIDGQMFERGRSHSVYWDGKNNRGNSICSGIYLCIMQSGEDDRFEKKMLLVK